MHLEHPLSFSLKLASSLLPSNNISYDNDCTIYPMEKQIRILFPLSFISTHAPFDLLHCHIWGSRKVPIHSGTLFFLAIVDDFTKCT